MIDYKTLLEKYMRRIIDSESVTFLDHWAPTTINIFTAADEHELREIEAYIRANPDPSRAEPLTTAGPVSLPDSRIINRADLVRALDDQQMIYGEMSVNGDVDDVVFALRDMGFTIA